MLIRVESGGALAIGQLSHAWLSGQSGAGVLETSTSPPTGSADVGEARAETPGGGSSAPPTATAP